MQFVGTTQTGSINYCSGHHDPNYVKDNHLDWSRSDDLPASCVADAAEPVRKGAFNVSTGLDLSQNYDFWMTGNPFQAATPLMLQDSDGIGALPHEGETLYANSIRRGSAPTMPIAKARDPKVVK
jgi:hypothetical protein